MVHEIFSLEKLTKLKLLHPEAQIIAHPECEAKILEIADFVGSTTALLNYSKKSNCKEFIVVTETGILHQMEKASPDKTFIPAPPNNSCACNDCPHMKLNTLEKIYVALKYEQPELIMSEQLIHDAAKPILKMLELSAKFGL
jgi:quinolinate synthase